MGLGLFQHQTQTINLVMTAQLKQAISLLQYSTMDLAHFIQEQALENPLIEIIENTPFLHAEEVYDQKQDIPRHAEFDRANMYNPIDSIADEMHKARYDLIEQVNTLPFSNQERQLLHYLIFNLDDNGYLTTAVSEMAGQLHISLDMVEKGIRQLQTLEPIGIGARNLQECLSLQANACCPNDALLLTVITEHLELLASGSYQKLASILETDTEEIKRIAAHIQTFDPKPYKNPQQPLVYMVPDITITKTDNGHSICINDHCLPKFQLNKSYMQLAHKHDGISGYIQQNSQHYRWLVNSMEKRKSTMLKITRVILQKQFDFLTYGFSRLEPMTLQSVAKLIDMHVSTVSRAVSNKIIQTPIGSFEMKKLFTTGLGNADGSSSSSAKVKLLLKQLIQGEDRNKPLSDQKIADYFKTKNNIVISRRTIAKYREELHILSSAKRRNPAN